MSARERIYEAAIVAARPALRLPATLHGKLRRGYAGRAGAVARLETWAREQRDPRRPLFWLHAPSVGEALMAQGIIAALRERSPDAQIAFTHFSPSAERVLDWLGADVTDYLPWDVAGDVRRALDALRPAALAFVRTEVWPVLAREAAARSVRLALVNAALSGSSSRLWGPTRWLLAPALARLDAVGAVADRDAANMARLGLHADRIRVTGDARFDQVWARVASLDRHSPLLRRLAGDGPLLVAGSTWPSDERRLLPAWAHALRDSGVRLIIAPHEPTAAHLIRLEKRLEALGTSHARLAAVEADGDGAVPSAVLVDRVGLLADLYAIARLAYVGGGFHRAGLHSVIEPAALRVAVFFGPHHGNAGEAVELAAAGGGFEVLDGAELADRLPRIAASPARAAQAGANALAWVRNRLGGAAANAELILGLVRDP